MQVVGKWTNGDIESEMVENEEQAWEAREDMLSNGCYHVRIIGLKEVGYCSDQDNHTVITESEQALFGM